MGRPRPPPGADQAALVAPLVEPAGLRVTADPQPGSTFAIDRADYTGIPTVAHCVVCDAIWTRPKNDPSARTLIEFGLIHDHQLSLWPNDP